MRKILLLLAATCLLTAPAYAELTPQQELEKAQKDIEKAKQRQEAIAAQNQKINDELKTLQDKLVKTAAGEQKAEFEMSDAEDKLRILAEQVTSKSANLKQQHGRLSRLIITELSISSTPPEAMMMMPQDPLDIIKAARALNMASDGIRAETESLAAQLAELNALKIKLTQRRSELKDIEATLEKQRQILVTQLTDRTALQAKLGKQEKQEEENLAKLARKSSDLKDLVSGIEKEEERHTRDIEAKHNKPTAETDAKHLRSFEDAKGHIRAPVAGQLLQRFGTSEGKNATAKGITIVTRSRAQVTAPYDGEVVFTGPFLNYGQMVIIRHSDEFHTLLAGLAKIDVSVGQFLLEGEPIGAMGESDSDSKNGRTLYIELRKDNQPVDPSQWISGLKKK